MKERERLVIVGGVAAGATAAARARRISESVDIVLLERGPYVSFANCGLPYYLSGDIKNRSQLLLQTPQGLDDRYRVQVDVNSEVVQLDAAGHRLRVKGPSGESWLGYDALILAQGSRPIAPNLPGGRAPHVFSLWSVPDMDAIEDFLQRSRPQTAVVVGGGFIGLEMTEALVARGLNVTVVELAPHVLGVMDAEFGHQVADHLRSHGVAVETGVGVSAVHEAPGRVELTDGRRLSADLVVFSVGVRPELDLARQAGLALGASGGLLVDEFLRTSDPSIWAAGDMVEVVHRVSGRRVRVPLAGPANRQGRIAATNALGGALPYRGALGSSIVKIFDVTAASTGLTEKTAREAGFPVGVCVVHKDHHAGYYPGAQPLTLKLVYERNQGRLLGAQALGREGVDKRIDVLATALAGRLTLDDLAELDLAYAPPYSSANDAVNIAAFVGQNDLSGQSPLVTADELAARSTPESSVILDVRSAGEFSRGHVPGALNIPIDDLRSRLDEVPREKTLYVHCAVGFRGHLAVRILKQSGFSNTLHVTGGYTSIRASGRFSEE